MVLKCDLKKLLASIIIPLGTGGLAALLTRKDMDLYKDIVKPPLSPPAVVFPIVWTILYVLMGISVYLIWIKHDSDKDKRNAFLYFGIQLFLNFIWTLVFFSARQFTVALVILVFMLIASIIMTVKFYRIGKTSGLLQIPYLIWLCIALYLNAGIVYLN